MRYISVQLSDFQAPVTCVACQEHSVKVWFFTYFNIDRFITQTFLYHYLLMMDAASIENCSTKWHSSASLSSNTTATKPDCLFESSHMATSQPIHHSLLGKSPRFRKKNLLPSRKSNTTNYLTFVTVALWPSLILQQQRLTKDIWLFLFSKDEELSITLKTTTQ